MKKTILLTLFSLTIICYSYAQCTVQGIAIKAFVADPNGLNNFDTDGNGSADAEDEFVQICNTTGSSVTLTGFTLSDNSSVGYSFPSGDAIPAGGCITIIRQWKNTSVSIPSYFREMGAGGGFFNNGGDDIVLSDGTNTCTVTYPSTSYPEQDGCATVIGSTAGAVDCSLTPSDLSSSPLPVDLITFTVSASDSKAALAWSTASELNNHYFDIEKSLDGKSFINIGRVEGHGNSRSIIHYNFVDYDLQRKSFYRLKQVDFDGQFHYSGIVSTKENESEILLIAQTSNTFVLNAELDTRIVVTNQRGQVETDKVITEKTILHKKDYASGLYIIQAITEAGIQTLKWVNSH